MTKDLEMSVWVKRGQMMVNRYALDGDDPDHPYNYIKSKYNVDPEDYGIEKPPLATVCPHCGERF
jgi:hypothetical protein